MGVKKWLVFDDAKGRNKLCNQLADQINTGITAEDIGHIVYAKGAGGEKAKPEDVEKLKLAQAALGMKEKDHTGYYGDKTAGATLGYQKNYNKSHKGDERLPETGTLDVRTYESLMHVHLTNIDKGPIKSPLSSSEALALEGKKTEKITEVAAAEPKKTEQKAVPQPQKPAETKVAAKEEKHEHPKISQNEAKEALRLLKAASITGSQVITSDNASHAKLEVYAMQTALNAAGYDDVKPNYKGKIDKTTETAIADFNQRTGGGKDTNIDADLAQKMQTYLKEGTKIADKHEDRKKISDNETVKAASDVLKSGTTLADSKHKTSDTNFAKSNLPIVSSTDKSIV